MLYIAGWDRSGSTILDQILGQLPGFFSVGELVDLWDRGPEALCGCGHVFKDCDIWREIFVKAFGITPNDFDFAAAEDYRRCCARLRHLCLLPSPLLRRSLDRPLRAYLELIRRLYRAVHAVSGSQMIVDSSKQPTHAYILELSDAVDLRILHLIRDPRGCAYSYQVSKAHPDPAIARMPLMSPARSSFHWLFANSATRRLWHLSSDRYMAVRYEDFSSRPRDTVSRICRFVGASVPDVPVSSQNMVLIRPHHGVSGNPVRFKTGIVELRCDERWKSAMRRRHKLLVTAFTGLALPTFGYHFGPTARGNRGLRNSDKAKKEEP